ncbi:MAG: esterase-like activity of phytase family protein [Bacteroidales bacterium]|nr:esterase-like activity of phytase family protein [Candidatus Cryptobacteroides aphodequi]
MPSDLMPGEIVVRRSDTPWPDDSDLHVFDSEGSSLAFQLRKTFDDGFSGVFNAFGAQLPAGRVYAVVGCGYCSDPCNIELDFSKQRIADGISNLASAGYMTGTALADAKGFADISVDHIGTDVRLSLEAGLGKEFTRGELIPLNKAFPLSLSFDVTLNNTSVLDSTFRWDIKTSWTGGDLDFVVPPYSGSSDSYALLMYDKYGSLYTSRLDGSVLDYGTNAWQTPLVKYSDNAGVKLPTYVLRNQHDISNATGGKGQFSGITYVGKEGNDYLFAITDDSKGNAGMYYLTVQFYGTSTDGYAARATSCVKAAGTTNVKGRDCEGITYIPSTGTFFVSGEDQKILEYDDEGMPTGRALKIPYDMGKGRVLNNNGFESLDYCPSTGLLWTTTEAPISKDRRYDEDTGLLIQERPLFRIQSFKLSTLAPEARYLYQMDMPLKPDPVTISYVHGISDICALNDGRLIVMEREVSIPDGYYDGTCRVKLYLVDPVNDKGGILSKSLLSEFYTNLGFSVMLANFEGICLGPLIEDAGGQKVQTILMICDSQGGMGKSTWLGDFYLSDWIKVITYIPE